MKTKALRPKKVVRFFVTARQINGKRVTLSYCPRLKQPIVWGADGVVNFDMQDIMDFSVPYSCWIEFKALLSSHKQSSALWIYHTDNPENERIIKSSIRVQKIKFEVCSSHTCNSQPFGSDGLVSDSL